MREIILTKEAITQVDDEDYDWLNRWSWHAIKGKVGLYYAAGSYGVMMHRLIMDTPDNMICHHKDGNGLNNQKYNLVNKTVSQHLTEHNRNINSGVCWHKRQKCYVSYIRKNGTQIHLGRFSNKEDALQAVKDTLV